jgi:predicted small secreted protein
MSNKFVILLALSMITLSLSACGHTINGVGKDFEEWGNTLQGN